MLLSRAVRSRTCVCTCTHCPSQLLDDFHSQKINWFPRTLSALYSQNELWKTTFTEDFLSSVKKSLYRSIYVRVHVWKGLVLISDTWNHTLKKFINNLNHYLGNLRLPRENNVSLFLTSLCYHICSYSTHYFMTVNLRPSLLRVTCWCVFLMFTLYLNILWNHIKLLYLCSDVHQV